MTSDGDAFTEPGFSASEESGPLYKVVERKILQCLAAREWKPGEQLPPESELAKRFGVAVFTVRAGVRNLVAANILTRRQGKGTFVTIHGRQPRFRFFNIHRNDGRNVLPGRRVIDFRFDVASPDIARLLRMASDRPADIIRFTMLLENVDGPISFYDVYAPTNLFAGLTEADIDTTTGNIYGLYQEKFGINVVRTEERVSAVKTDERSAALLRMPLGEPILQVDRIAYTFNDEPVEFRRIFHETKHHHYLLKQGLDQLREMP